MLAEDADILTALAQTDDDAAVRRSAVKCLVDLASLRERAESDDNACVRETATNRYRQLLAGGGDELSLDGRLQELQICEDSSVLAHVARTGREPEVRLAALARVNSEAVLLEAACNDNARKVREVALERLTAAESLEQVASTLKERDKRLAKTARDRLRAVEEAQLRARRNEQAYQVLLTELQAHRQAPMSQGYRAATQRLQNRWQGVDGVPPEVLAKQWQEALERCQARAETEVVPEAEAAAESAELSEAGLSVWERLPAEPTEQDIAELCRIAPANDPLFAAYLRQAQRYIAERKGIRETVEVLADLPQLSDAQLKKKLRRLESLIERVAWEPVAPGPVGLEAAQSTLVAGLAEQQRRRERNAKYSKELESCLQALDDALTEGTLRKARECFKQARSLIDHLPDQAKSDANQRLRPYQARLSELRDWRRFATLPKQRMLCEQMEALLHSELEPAELSAQSKRLQQEWQATGGSDSAEGRELWERFRQASEQIHERCRPFFEQQKQLRERNLAERERICVQLEGFIGSEKFDQADGDFLAKVRQQARTEWQATGLVERKSGRVAQRRFDGLMRQLSERIELLSRQRCEQRQRVLDSAIAVRDGDNELSAKIDKIKVLQQEWRQIGRISTAQERRLMSEWRAVCDAIFQRREEVRQASEQRRQSNLEQAKDLCEQVQALVAAEPAEVARQVGKWRGLAAHLSKIGPLPRDAQAEIKKTMERLVATGESQLRAYRLTQELACLDRWARLAELCAELEAVEAGNETRLAELEQAWSAEAEVPVPLRARWQRAREALSAGDGGAAASASDEARELRRRLCVRLEILAGMVSPDEDKALRMDLQVERLAQGLSAGGEERVHEAARDIALDWYGLSRSAKSDGDLEQRLRRAFETAWQSAEGAQAVVSAKPTSAFGPLKQHI
ncbi:DUF349 domain-containing protein [Alkalilimnicola ehrlichii]|nr:DUF349 domain-containing protein [Alkalilimnicola ehrlichii]